MAGKFTITEQNDATKTGWVGKTEYPTKEAAIMAAETRMGDPAHKRKFFCVQVRDAKWNVVWELRGKA